VTSAVVKYERAKMYPKQEEALFHEERYGVVEASTKSGKTVGCLVWLHEMAALRGGPNRNFWWIAPIFAVTKIAFRRLKTYLPEGTFTSNETELTITLRNGAVIWFKSAEKPDSLYGEDVFAAVIDEATRVKADSWYAVRTTLTATEAPVRIIGNVKGRRNWAYKLARRAEGGAAGYHYAKLTVWDAVDAGVFSLEEAEDARDILPEDVYRELYLAEAADDSSAFFKVENIGVVGGFPEHGRMARAWDFAASEVRAGSEPDYTAGVKLVHDGTMTYVVDVVRFREAPDDVLSRLGVTAAADGKLCDQVMEEEFGAAGKIMLAQLKTFLAGVSGAGNVIGASPSGGKAARAFHFASACNDGRVNLVEGSWNAAFLDELADFLEGGVHDDQVDAAAYAYNRLAPRAKAGIRWL